MDPLRDPDAALLGTYPDVNTWWARRLQGQLQIVSPNLDGTNQQIAFETPFDVIKKALTTATTGAFNPLFSYLLQTQIVQEANLYNALPKEPWRPKTIGWRAKTVAAVTGNVGVAEASAVPADADATYQEIQPTLKEFTHAWGLSRRLIDSVNIADVVSWDQDIEQHTLDFFRAVNADMWAALATVEANNMEAIRNLMSSFSELTGKSLAADSIDPWLNVDRDAGASFADANALHNSGVDRDLSVQDVDTLRENQEPFWEGNKLANKLYVSRYNTHARLSRLEAAKQRFGTERAQLTVGGMKSSPGQDTGFKISAWDGMIYIRDDQGTQETIGDLLLLDLNHIAISELRPFEIADEENPFVTGYSRRALWYGSGELTNTLFGAHGVLTDLQ